jgi:hypothetical protein
MQNVPKLAFLTNRNVHFMWRLTLHEDKVISHGNVVSEYNSGSGSRVLMTKNFKILQLKKILRLNYFS